MSLRAVRRRTPSSAVRWGGRGVSVKGTPGGGGGGGGDDSDGKFVPPRPDGL